ncbi:MAG: Ig-like domain-containing protein [Bacteroidetes bacterium]|nr:Ig-like domain-containing protein [Bacteroidota bacterium]MCH8941393.1 Ig-like domain-containing protein [Bacteroidota bacterium]
MGKTAKEKFKTEIIIIFLSFLFLSGCANQLPPEGGEVDKIPPEIEEFYPPNGTINFLDDHISFDFSEYVDKRSFKEAVFISPQIEGELKYNWSGTNVTIEFPNTLKANTTYVVTIGTDVADVNNRNKMAQSFSLTFSTGNEIDKRSIIGKVFDNNPSGVMIYAYKINADTLDPHKIKPTYITQSGKNGSYKLDGLSAGKFRVFAVRDKFKDFLFQPKQDEIGISNEDVIFIKNDTTVKNINFKLSMNDSFPPRIMKAIMTDSKHVLINFSEDLAQSSIKLKNFSIIDSTQNKTYYFRNIYRKYPKKNQIVLINDNQLVDNSNLFLHTSNLKDVQGNTTKKDFVRLLYSNREDTSKPGLINTFPPLGNSEADYVGQKFEFYFSDYFDTSTAKSGIDFTDANSNNIAFSTIFFDNASFSIKANIDLLPVKNYKIIIDLSKIRNKNRTSADSNYVYNFTTINGLNFSGVSGELKNLNTDDPVYIILIGLDKSKKIYKQLLRKDRKFIINRVVSGSYKLWCFIDSDKNGKYSFGTAVPFKPGEKFSYLKSTLELKPRWMQTDLIFDFENKIN